MVRSPRASGGRLLLVIGMTLVGCVSVSPPSASPGQSNLSTPAPASTATIGPGASEVPTSVPPATDFAPPTPSGTVPVSPQPTPTAAETPTPDPTGAAPTPTATVPVTPSPTPDTTGWSEFGWIFDRAWFDPQMVIDDQGFAHVVAINESNRSIYYLTNSSGAWERRRISDAPRQKEDSDPVIAIDATDGSIWVAFVRRSAVSAPNFSEGIYLLRGGAGGFSQAAFLEFGGESPSIAVASGVVHLLHDGFSDSAVDLEDVNRPEYATNAGGDWVSTPLTEIGRGLAIFRGDNGRVRALISAWDGGDGDNKHAFVATQSATDPMAFDLEQVPGLEAGHIDGSFGRYGVPAVGWFGDNGVDRFKVATNGGWSDATRGEAATVDSAGNVHYLRMDPLEGGDGAEVWYRTDREGGFGSRQIWIGSSGGGPTVLALDSQDRPHIFFTGIDTLYGIGPAR